MTKLERFNYVASLLQDIAGKALEKDLFVWYDWSPHVNWFQVTGFAGFKDPKNYINNTRVSNQIHIKSDELMQDDIKALIKAVNENGLEYEMPKS